MREVVTDVRGISRIAYAFMGSKALFAALDLNLFDLMSHHPLGLDSLADLTRIAPNRLSTLLTVLQSLGLVSVEHDHFANSPAAQKYLVRASGAFVGDYYRLQIDKLVYPQFAGLTEGLRGNPPQSIRDMLASPEQATLFTNAQHQGSLGPALLLSRTIDLTGRRALLDVAGGSGAFSIVLCRRYPELHATLIDFPSVVEVAAKFTADAGLADRITLLGGDALEIKWPSGHDVVLMSYLLSAAGSDMPRMMRLAYEATGTGAMVIVHDFMLDEDRNGPREAAQFFLSYIAYRTDSASFNAKDVAAMMREAGFDVKRSEPLIPGLTGLVIGERNS